MSLQFNRLNPPVAFSGWAEWFRRSDVLQKCHTPSPIACFAMWTEMELTLFHYRSPQSSEIATRVFIDLKGCDQLFLKECEEIFQVNYGLDREGTRMLKDYILISISEIVALYSMNQMTLYGTLNMGPDERRYEGLLDHTEDQIKDFEVAYKALAVRLSAILSIHLEDYLNKAIDRGYGDVSCSVSKYVPGSLLLNMRGIHPFSDRR